MLSASALPRSSNFWRLAEILDFLRKSWPVERTFAEGDHEIDPKLEPAPSVAVRFLEDAEDLEPPDNVLHGQPDPIELAVAPSLVIGKRMMLAGLLRGPSERVLVVKTLLPSVSEEFGVGMDGGLRLLQESKIMHRPTARGDAEDLRGERMDQELQFQRVALLFPAVPVPLLSWAERHPYGACPLFWGVHTAPRSRPRRRPSAPCQRPSEFLPR